VLCRSAPWRSLREWREQDGRIVHGSGRFFSVVGAKACSACSPAEPVFQPLIDQPEVGILGFLARKTARGPELLLQAKAEPGNVEGVQVAPSVQATESNYTRVHGGTPTAYLEFFLQPEVSTSLASTLQSEQGTRFVGKYNCNSMVQAPRELAPHSEDWRWFPADDVSQSLARDFLFNTDARSSLLCGDWRWLCSTGEPFGRWCADTGFGGLLLRSYSADRAASQNAVAGVMRRLQHLRRVWRFELQRIPLSDLPGWCKDEERIADEQRARFEVRGYGVEIANREVPRWDQPLVGSFGEGAVTLLCQVKRGVLHFLLRPSVEIGFRECVQLGPSFQLGDGPSSPCGPIESWRAAHEAAQEQSEEILSCLQSDEGGRFHRSVTRYSVRLLRENAPQGVVDDNCDFWVTLSQVQQLLRVQGALTNEARSALSLLLTYV
jgi:oxidase EvaA